MIKLVINGKPITKKNSMRMVTNKKTGRVFPIPSKQFVEYQKLFLSQVRRPQAPIDQPVNVRRSIICRPSTESILLTF